MKRFFSLFLIFLVVIYCNFVETAYAQEQTKIGFFSIKSGIVFPSVPGEMRQNWKNGLSLGIGFTDTIGVGPWGYAELGAGVSYQRFEIDKEKYRNSLNLSRYPNLDRASISISGGVTEIVLVMATFKGTFSNLNEFFHPYFISGLGVITSTRHDINATFNEGLFYNRKKVISKIGWEIGAGVDVPIGNVVVMFLEGRYALGSSKKGDTQVYPIDIGVRLNF